MLLISLILRALVQLFRCLLQWEVGVTNVSILWLLEMSPMLATEGDLDKTAQHTLQADIVSRVLVPGGGHPTKGSQQSGQR